jgi:hypothetical protein
MALAGVVVFGVTIAAAQARVGAAGSVSGLVPAKGTSSDPDVSSDGRFVAFDSDASNIVAGDTNGWRDVFVRDRLTGKAERVSISTSGKQGNSVSSGPSISADGRYVFFDSNASNLVSGDTNDSWDVFVRDRVSGTTERVSLSNTGKQGNDDGFGSLISPDGRYVLFDSYASNLVAGDRHGYLDVFVRDLNTGRTERVSISSRGAGGRGTSWGEGISPDGRFVNFASWAGNLVSRDTNRNMDVFARDRLTGSTERVSVDSAGRQANGESDFGSMSADGRFVAFHSNASNLVADDTNKTWDVFVRDRQDQTTDRVSVSSAGRQGNRRSNSPLITDDGRYVLFDSTASNLVPNDTNRQRDVFVHDRSTGTTERLSVSSAGKQANDSAFLYAISGPDARFLVFVSKASDLVPGDTNNNWDVFLRDRQNGTTELISAARAKR